MAVNREFRCTFHDLEFESLEARPACPCGCDPSMVVLEFRTPFGLKGDRTRVTDNLQRQLAADYGMSDMRGDKEGTSVMSNTPMRSGGARLIGDQGKAYWKPDLFQVKSGWTARGEPDPVFRPPAGMTCAATPIHQIREGASQYLKQATRYVAPPKR